MRRQCTEKLELLSELDAEHVKEMDQVSSMFRIRPRAMAGGGYGVMVMGLGWLHTYGDKNGHCHGSSMVSDGPGSGDNYAI